jgi:hypothetical protein
VDGERLVMAHDVRRRVLPGRRPGPARVLRQPICRTAPEPEPIGHHPGGHRGFPAFEVPPINTTRTSRIADLNPARSRLACLT